MQLKVCYRFSRDKTTPRQLYSCKFATGFAATKPLFVIYTAVVAVQVLQLQKRPLACSFVLLIFAAAKTGVSFVGEKLILPLQNCFSISAAATVKLIACNYKCALHRDKTLQVQI